MESADRGAAVMGEEARCASHPDQAAEATCARCGSFVCGACLSPELPEHCHDCAHRLGQGRLVTQVPALGVTMIVHGAFSAGMGLYFLVFGIFFAHSLATGAPPPDAPPGDDPLDGLLSGLVFGAVGGEALLHLVPGALQIWAGLRVRKFRSRALAFAALGAGLSTILGCYCAPTSLGLLVWGVIVLASADVAARFSAVRRSGRS